MQWQDVDLSIASVLGYYQRGDCTPRQLIGQLLEKCAAFNDHNIWIKRFDLDFLEPYLQRLESADIENLPLFGVPFAIKDNIDMAGVSTTAGCPQFAYTAKRHSFIVRKLIDLGAIPLGKTNMDQFATGLSGTRSPYGACRNAYEPNYISGGSSSGSAVAVALDLVSFSLGTDTAGSGRIPASLNNIIGWKPSRGLLSNRGVVPACRSLDCVSIFCQSIDDLPLLFETLIEFDPKDPYSRPFDRRYFASPNHPNLMNLRVGLPAAADLDFFGDQHSQRLFERTVKTLANAGVEIVEIDYSRFTQAAKLLYQGPWLTERQISLAKPLKDFPEALDPAIVQILTDKAFSGKDVFNGFYELQKLRRTVNAQLSKVDVLLTPTNGVQYTIDQMLQDPITLNNNLGYYSNHMNLLDCCGLSIPTGFTQPGVPMGVTLMANAFGDRKLVNIARSILPVLRGTRKLT